MGKQNIPKNWYPDIIISAANNTKIKIEAYKKLSDNGLHFIFYNKQDAKKFEDEIGQHIIKAIKNYIELHDLDTSEYLMNLLFTTARENIVVNIYW